MCLCVALIFVSHTPATSCNDIIGSSQGLPYEFAACAVLDGDSDTRLPRNMNRKKKLDAP